MGWTGAIKFHPMLATRQADRCKMVEMAIVSPHVTPQVCAYTKGTKMAPQTSARLATCIATCIATPTPYVWSATFTVSHL